VDVRLPGRSGLHLININRLKMLRRQMYGRAGVELLRARLLPAPATL
jgi:transposase